MSFANQYHRQVETFVEVCRRLAARMYVTGFGGNLAWKLEDDLVLITPTQMNKGDIQNEDVVFINLRGEVAEGTRKPTGEKPMYLNFFNKRPDIVSVIHCHAPYACAAAIMEDASVLMRPFFPETVTEIGPVPVVPYAQPLTQNLADYFLPFLQKYNSFLMENHGLVSMSQGDILQTMMNVELFECSVQSVLIAKSAGKLKELDRKAVQDLGNVMKERNLPLFGSPGANQSLVEMYF
jgi:L-fuculose-phosphate aldolase